MCYLNRSTFHLVLIFLLNLCHSKDTFRIEKNYVVIQDDSSPFEQRVKITDRTNFSICADSHTIYCLQWQDHTLFNVTEKNECKFFKYTSTTEDQLRVSFNTSSIHIYGGAETDYQKWPAENIEYENFPFVSSSTRSQAVLEPFWIFSTGHYLYVEKGVPLFISMSKTENKFEILAENLNPYMAANETILKYRICTLGDMKKAYLHAVENVLGKPKKIMDAIMVQKPIWSTWVKFKENISVKILGDYIDEILLHDFPISHLEIDDKWEDCYGSLTLDTSRFPDFKKFVTKLKSKGIRTTIWVHPFINLDCHPFYEQAETNGYFVRNATGIRTTWWNGDAGYLDFTNNETSLWFQKRLEKLKNDTGVDSFKFDAGESSWSPERATFKTMDSSYPETILKSYVKMASNFGNMVEVRVGRGTQQYGIFVRMLDTDSLWNGPKTLETFIPTLLQMNMLGYPFVLPDMIGGNEYNGNKITDELLIRWLQANVFMPTLQFSVPPWDFGKEITKIALKMVKLHKTYSNEILYLMKQSTKTGIPVNLPLWWISPNDTITYNISDEFLLGENILVAPVLIKGAQSRDIYLPKGAWRAENKKKSKLIVGPKWLRNYKAEIDTLPYFIKEYNNGQAPQKFAFNKAIISLITVIILSLI